jgi:hypothetical protein
MSTTTVNATYQGYCRLTTNFYFSDWVFDVRDAPTATTAVTYTTNTTTDQALQAYEIFSRLGTTGVCSRTFLFFENLDTAVGGGIITAATLRVFGGSSGDLLNTVTVKGDAWGSNGSDGNLNTGDYGDLDFATPYSNELYGWNLNAYNDFELNSSAIDDMNNNGYLNIVVIDYDYDYLGVSPGVGAFQAANGVEFLDSTDPIKLVISYVPSFEVLGISPLLVSKVVGVSFGNIKKVIGYPPF